MLSKEEILNELPNFTGTESYYRHIKILYTDGVAYICSSCDAFWLLDIVESYQYHPVVSKEEFQTYKLTTRPDKTSIVEIGDGNRIIFRQEIEYSDFPLETIDYWFENGICYLPSER